MLLGRPLWPSLCNNRAVDQPRPSLTSREGAVTSAVILTLAVLSLRASALAQAPPGPSQTAVSQDDKPALEAHEEPLLVEFGGFTNFVDRNYGQWRGVNGRLMYRGAKHFVPVVSLATQTRPEGSQVTLGADAYILVNKWFYSIAGIGGSPSGSAVLWPRRRFNVMGAISIPRAPGLVGTVGVARIDGEAGHYDRILSTGALYYRGPTIWSGSVSFNRNYPGDARSASATIAVQHGAQKKYWAGVGFVAGRVAYQTISLTPLDVRFFSYGQSVFYSKWVSRKWGFTGRYEYQNQVDAYQRHGIAVSLFVEGP